MTTNAPYCWLQASTPTIAGPVYALAEKETRETAVFPSVCLLQPSRPGNSCPFCQQGALTYDALFLLTCPVCHQVTEAGCFT